MSKFSMNPIPNRKKFITTFVSSLVNLYKNLKYPDSDFAKGVYSCHQKIYKYVVNESYNECTMNDILDIYNQLCKLEYSGSGIFGNQVQEMEDLKRYIQDYELSQKVKTNSRKSIPDVYQKQVESDFINDTIDFLANLYNRSDQRTQISKSIRECVEIFWEYDVTWQRKDIATRDTIRELQSKLNEIQMTREDEFSEIGKQLRLFKLYIKNWFYYEHNSASPQNSTPDIKTSDNTTDINARVKQLEEEVQELRTKVEALLFEHPPETLLFEKPPPLERSVLLGQLARHT